MTALDAREKELRQRSVVALREVARARGMSGWAGADRDRLARLIAEHEAAGAQTAAATPSPLVLWLVLKRCRENRGLSTRQAAERTGVGHTVIARCESGRHGVREDILARIAAGYGITIRELLLEGLAESTAGPHK